ncbi:hypothetical protein FACS189443_3270 [Planctomycetales bacterium]|nr:hypothetical protein FACS189443_3270 [Planctomycetales bacterium]
MMKRLTFNFCGSLILTASIFSAAAFVADAQPAQQEPPKPETTLDTPTEKDAPTEPAKDAVKGVASEYAEPAEPGFVKTREEVEALGPKNKAFIERFIEFQDFGKKLTSMKVEYQDAKPERQSEIDIEYPQLYKQGLGIYQKVLTLAEEAHKEAPNRNPYVNNLLHATVIYDFQRENYEGAVRVFRELAKGGLAPEANALYAYAGFAALLTMDLKEADAWLKTAEKDGVLEKVFKSLGGSKKGQEYAQTLSMMLKMMPNFEIDWANEDKIRKAETEAGEKDPEKKLPRVELTTTKGKIVLELFENEAPNTVANFINLVEKGFYNDTLFHRVLPHFMAQGGDPQGTGAGGPGYAIDDECGKKFPNQRKHFRGSISMANAGPNTNGSQFFLTFIPTSFLDGKHTVFGRVVDGMEVLADIQRIDPEDKDATIPEIDRIVSAKVLNKRNHPYEPKKNANRR